MRLRREQSLQVTGAGTLPSIVARLQDDVSGVTTVKGYENRTDVIDVSGRPPHSIEMVVEGGDDQDIIDTLWLVKGGGIQTFGNTSGVAVDSNGNNQTLYFSRPTPRMARKARIRGPCLPGTCTDVVPLFVSFVPFVVKNVRN